MVQQGSQKREIFVGRVDGQVQYQKFLRGEGRQWVLLLTGIPGIGKTTLLRRFQAHTPATLKLGTMLLNFDDTAPYPHLRTDPLQVLEAMAVGVRDMCQHDLYEECMRILHEGQEHLKQYKKRLEKQLELLNRSLLDPREREARAQQKQQLLAKEQETRQDVREGVMEAFFTQIETLEQAGVVLFLDTCERLNELESWEVGKWLLGEFLPELHTCLVRVKKTCLVVLASRVPPKFDVLQEQEQKRLQLDMLSKEQVFEYLDLAGLDTKEDTFEEWKEWVYKTTHGHPLSLAIMRDLWSPEDKNLPSDRSANLDAFQFGFDDTLTQKFAEEFDHTVSTKFVEERILKRLRPIFQTFTEYTAVLRSFNLEQLQQLFPELLPESEAHKLFDEFVSYSYIEPIGNHRYIFHEFIREVLARYVQEKYPEGWKGYHQVAFDAVSDPDSPDWYYHWMAINETEGVQAWQEAVEQAQLARDGEAIGALVQIAMDQTLHLSLISQAIISDKVKQLYQEVGQEEAVAEVDRQLTLLRQAIEQKAGVLESQGDEQREQGDREAALVSYRQALQHFQDLGGHAGDEARLQEAIRELEQPPVPIVEQRKDVPERKTRAVPFVLVQIRKRPVVTTGVSLLLLALVCLLLFLTLFRSGPVNPFPVQQPPGIGVTHLANGELIGVSNGAFAFDADCRTDASLKCQAASRFREGNIAGAESLWSRALAVTTNDAEMLIYLEDQRVLHAPHITLVVATTLTGASVNQGRDNLQGAYIAQKEYNDGLKLPGGMQVSLLIANFGSDPANATRVARQIVQAAQADKSIVGVMGLPLSAYVPATIAILQQAHLPLVSSGAGSDALSGISPDFFRIVPPDAMQAQVGAAYAVQTLHAHTVALFFDPHDPSSNSLAKDVQQDFTAYRGVAVVDEKYTVGHPETLNTLLTDAMKQHADLLYFTGYVTDLNIVLINLPASSKLAVMGSDSFYQLQDYSIGSRSGFTHLHFTAFAYPDEWDILCYSEPVKSCPRPSFFTSYAQVFDDGKHQDRPYGYTRADSGTIVSYDALSVLLSGCQLALLKSQATTLTPDQVLSALKMITGQHAFQGLSGQISFGKNGDAINKSLVLLYVDQNNFIKVIPGNWIQGCYFAGHCNNTRNAA